MVAIRANVLGGSTSFLQFKSAELYNLQLPGRILSADLYDEP